MALRNRRIDELARVEFTGSLTVATYDYGQAMFALGHLLRMELDMAAVESEAAMASLKGHPLLLGLDVRVKARRVAKRLKRAQDLAYGLTAEGHRFHRDYLKYFVDQARK